MPVPRDPTAKKSVRSFKQIEAAFSRLDAHETKVRAKYEPVQKGEPFKKSTGGQSHRFANVLKWEDDISTIRPKKTEDSLTGAARPATAPTAHIKSRALETAFSTQVLANGAPAPDNRDPTASPRYVDSATAVASGLGRKQHRRHSAAPLRPPASPAATPRRPSPGSRQPQPQEEDGMEVGELLEGDLLEEEESLIMPETVIASNGIISRRPPSASIATAKARRILSARHFRPPVTMVDAEELEDLKWLTGVSAGSSRPSSAVSGRGPSPGRRASPGRKASPGRDASTERPRRRPATARAHASASPGSAADGSSTHSLVTSGGKARPVSAFPGYRPSVPAPGGPIKIAPAPGQGGHRHSNGASTGARPTSARPLTAGSSRSSVVPRVPSEQPSSQQRPASAVSRWSLPSSENVAGAESFATRRMARLTEGEVCRGVQGLMEAGQSGRHLRAIRTARREMWDSIASSAGIPVCARVSVGAALSVGDDPFSDAPPHGEEDDIVVIQEEEHEEEQVVSMAAASRYSATCDAEEEDAARPSASAVDTAPAPLLDRLGGMPLHGVPEAEDEGRSSLASSVHSKDGLPSATPHGEERQCDSEAGSGAAGVQQGQAGPRSRPQTAPASSRRRPGAPRPRADGGALSGGRSSFWATSNPASYGKQAREQQRVQSARVPPAGRAPPSPAAARPPSSPPRPVSPGPSDPLGTASRLEEIMHMMAPGLRANLPTPEEDLNLAVDGGTKALEERANPSEVARKSERARSARGRRVTSGSSFWKLDASTSQPELGARTVGVKVPVLADLTALFPGPGVAMDSGRTSPAPPIDGADVDSHPRADAHLTREFYQLQVAVDAGSIGDISTWLFDVTLSEVGGAGRSVTAGRNMHVDRSNNVVFYPDSHRADPTVLSPLDLLPWVTAPEQLFRQSLHIEVWSSAPQRMKVVDTKVWFGPWDEEPPSTAPASPEPAGNPQVADSPRAGDTGTALQLPAVAESDEAAGVDAEARPPLPEVAVPSQAAPPCESERSIPRSPISLSSKLAGPLARPTSARPLSSHPGNRSGSADVAPRAQSVSSAAPQRTAPEQSRDEILQRLRHLDEASQLPVAKIGAVRM
eukprot:jgi/Tetstr1/448204/TSEL_035493.t2